MNYIAKKRFGQNFLKDESVLNKIIEAMPKNSNHIVEIGPGLGDLTDKLVKIKDVTAYEVDRDLFAYLKNKFANEIENSRLNLILTDVLEVWKNRQTLHKKNFDLIANLPYYIATNIILKCFEDSNCKNIIVMVQKEVAKKFVADVGDKEFSGLSVITKLITKKAKIIAKVPPTSFNPPPKVDSSVVYFEKTDFKIDDEFKIFLKLAFSSPRKKLIKNLSNRFDKSKLDEIFQSLQIKESLRPHQVEASLYLQIYNNL